MDSLNLASHETEAIEKVVGKLDLKGGHWSIRHLEYMKELIDQEVKRRENL